MNRLIALALVVSLTARAQEADVIEVREARIATPANEILDVQGGIYLSPSGSSQIARKIVSQEQEIKTLKAENVHPIVVVAIALGGAIAAGLGGFFAGKAAAK
ncbi:MAG: hypothetical protein ABT940_10895 [Alphaproteobacteria bacterium]